MKFSIKKMLFLSFGLMPLAVLSQDRIYVENHGSFRDLKSADDIKRATVVFTVLGNKKVTLPPHSYIAFPYSKEFASQGIKAHQKSGGVVEFDFTRYFPASPVSISLQNKEDGRIEMSIGYYPVNKNFEGTPAKEHKLTRVSNTTIEDIVAQEEDRSFTNWARDLINGYRYNRKYIVE